MLFAQSQAQVITRTFSPDTGMPLHVKIRGDGAEIMLESVARDGEGRARYRYHEDRFSGTLDWIADKNLFEAELDMKMSSFDKDEEGHESELEVLLPRNPEVDLDVSLKAGVIKLDGKNLTFDNLELALWAGELNASFPSVSSKVINRVEVDVKLGEMRVENLGNLAFEVLDVNGFAGEIVLDFSGDLKMNREARVDLELGSMTVIVPAGMTVRARVSKLGFLAEVDIPRGWSRDGRYVYSPGASRSEADLKLDLQGGIGEIVIRVK
jgi:hypothetical protein